MLEQRRKATRGSRRELGDNTLILHMRGEEMTKNKDKFQYSLDNGHQTEEMETASYLPRIKLSTDHFQGMKLWEEFITSILQHLDYTGLVQTH